MSQLFSLFRFPLFSILGSEVHKPQSCLTSISYSWNSTIWNCASLFLFNFLLRTSPELLVLLCLFYFAQRAQIYLSADMLLKNITSRFSSFLTVENKKNRLHCFILFLCYWKRCCLHGSVLVWLCFLRSSSIIHHFQNRVSYHSHHGSEFSITISVS